MATSVPRPRPVPGVAAHDRPVRTRRDLLREVQGQDRVQGIEAVTMKNGRAATRSVCVECGTKKFRIGVLP